MSTDEIAYLCNALSISEKEGPTQILDRVLKEKGSQKLTLCLFGKIFTTKVINKSAFIDVFSKVWRVEGGGDFELVEGNIFVLYFRTVEVKARILMGGSWHFDRAIILLEEPSGTGDITELKFNRVEFWIQIHNVPLICMSEEAGVFLGKIIGDVREVDLENGKGESERFIRVRIGIDVNIPLKRSLRVEILGSGNWRKKNLTPPISSNVDRRLEVEQISGTRKEGERLESSVACMYTDINRNLGSGNDTNGTPVGGAKLIEGSSTVTISFSDDDFGPVLSGGPANTNSKDTKMENLVMGREGNFEMDKGKETVDLGDPNRAVGDNNDSNNIKHQKSRSWKRTQSDNTKKKESRELGIVLGKQQSQSSRIGEDGLYEAKRATTRKSLACRILSSTIRRSQRL
ncbi:hypothetical protein Dsin_008826 [Dipteronia sinensis]|uniref:DUF4283 domain-containing protein n=1 Tax=Dipteronia sinensis TaxID=43782 RepID=A0AAE0APC3_9ROSI|nr:hypothetical protein Dsin_008826 [Dipteronia sinensis]